MSPIQVNIKEAMKAAMRAKDKVRLGTIRLILADFKRIEVDERIDLDDTRVLAVLDKMSKQRRDSIKQYEEANRNDLAEQERNELLVIQEYLPEALTDDEINQLINECIQQANAQSMQDMGKVMGLLKPKVQGRADMGSISKLIKQKINN